MEKYFKDIVDNFKNNWYSYFLIAVMGRATYLMITQSSNINAEYLSIVTILIIIYLDIQRILIAMQEGVKIITEIARRVEKNDI